MTLARCAMFSGADSGTSILLMSYRRDRPYALTRQDGCRYRGIRGDVMSLDCAVLSKRSM